MECAMRSIGAASESASSHRLSSEQRSSSVSIEPLAMKSMKQKKKSRAGSTCPLQVSLADGCISRCGCPRPPGLPMLAACRTTSF